MENILKLSLKKDLFESVKNGVNELQFEISGYYFGRFTTSKNNTVDDLKADRNLFKQFDAVNFTCNGENITFSNVYVDLQENEGEYSFVLLFENEVKESVEETEEPKEEVEETVEETVNEINTMSEPLLGVVVENLPTETVATVDEPESIIEDKPTPVAVETPTPQYSESEVGDLLGDFLNEPNVYTVARPIFKISYMGKVFGSNKRLPLSNNHDYSMNTVSEVVSLTKLPEFLNNLKSQGYVFICLNNSTLDGGNVNLSYATLSRFTAKSII